MGKVRVKAFNLTAVIYATTNVQQWGIIANARERELATRNQPWWVEVVRTMMTFVLLSPVQLPCQQSR